MPEADILANALSSQWNYTTKPYEPKFIELFIDSDRTYIINIDTIMRVDKQHNRVCMRDGYQFSITKPSMHKILEVLNYA